jgi:ribosomal protein S18 acetylase RimI-like enzyme
MPSPSPNLPVLLIRFWQHWRAVSQIYRAYPPGADAIVDHIRSMSFLTRFWYRFLLGPLYFASEQGWMVRGEHGDMAAIMYLRRGAHRGIHVLHIDDISVNADYRRLGLAHRLMMLAEELACREQRLFLKLAVTVANTPAVTLYRRLGYQEQHHRFFTYAPASSAQHLSLSGNVALRPLRRGQAAEALRRFYQLEVTASVPALAGMLVAYYPRTVPKGATRLYSLEQSGQQIGCGVVYRQEARWNLDLSLRPDLWGSDSERQAILLLTKVIRHEPGSTIAVHVPSAAHFDALCTGANALARELGLVEQNYERMLMVKPL